MPDDKDPTLDPSLLALALPGELFIASASEAALRPVQRGPSAGWMLARGITHWSREASVVRKSDITQELRKELKVMFPEEQIVAAKYPRALLAAQACPLVAVPTDLANKLVAKGVRVHTVGFDSLTTGFFYIAEGGGETSRVEGDLVEMVASSMAETASNDDIESSLDGMIDRILDAATAGTVREIDIELADALPKLAHFTSGLFGAGTEGFEKESLALHQGSAPFEEAIKAILKTLDGATGADASIPMFGTAKREAQNARELPNRDGAVKVPARERWIVVGIPAIDGAKAPERPVEVKPVSAAAALLARRKPVGETPAPSKVEDTTKVAEEAAKIAAKKLADETAAKKLADETAAKKLADETAAKKLADDAVRKKLADEAAAKQKADDEATAAKKLADDAARKKLADEAAAKQKADDEAAAAKKLADDAARKKLAEEATAKQKANDEAAAAKKLADDAARKKLAEEAAAKQKANDEAAAKKLADDAARKKLAEEKQQSDEAAAKKLADEAVASKGPKPAVLTPIIAPRIEATRPIELAVGTTLPSKRIEVSATGSVIVDSKPFDPQAPGDAPMSAQPEPKPIQPETQPAAGEKIDAEGTGKVRAGKAAQRAAKLAKKAERKASRQESNKALTPDRKASAKAGTKPKGAREDSDVDEDDDDDDEVDVPSQPKEVASKAKTPLKVVEKTSETKGTEPKVAAKVEPIAEPAVETTPGSGRWIVIGLIAAVIIAIVMFAMKK